MLNAFVVLCLTLPTESTASGVPSTSIVCRVKLVVVDKGAAALIPCRIHLKNPAGKPVKADDLPFWKDHFVCPGQAELDLTPGRYQYEIERGPEYTRCEGELRAEGPEKVLRIELDRLTDMAAQGWWSGDLHVHRPVKEIELLMRAEDLHVAPVITWWNDRNEWADRPIPTDPLVRFDGNRYYHVMAGEDEREGGAILYFNLPRPLAITGSSREYPSPVRFLTEARRFPNVRVDIEKPFWWDVPVWLASGKADTIGTANNHMCRSRMNEDEAWGRARDDKRLPSPLGNGYWSQEIYYHILNCGLRIPPSAGSASGVLPNPVGYDRVYVHVPGELSYEKWWGGLCAGRSFVTNGPLLRVLANGEFPGHVFASPDGKGLDLNVRAELTTRDRIRSIEIVRNGRVERSVRSEELARSGSLGRLSFAESGWFLVRAIADNDKTFRFASTAPFYVEIGDNQRRISRASVRFFLDWIDERAKRIKLDKAEQRREVLRYHNAARRYWEELLAKANAE